MRLISPTSLAFLSFANLTKKPLCGAFLLGAVKRRLAMSSILSSLDLGQCQSLNSSRQSALLASGFVLVDDLFISHAVNDACCLA